ncbi:MAG: hypothetical protein KAR13_17745 [Desulfobulbaceae bacterium]|nr:hypothetical protein [Desulfobulbaceae bacterium]
MRWQGGSQIPDYEYGRRGYASGPQVGAAQHAGEGEAKCRGAVGCA